MLLNIHFKSEHIGASCTINDIIDGYRGKQCHSQMASNNDDDAGTKNTEQIQTTI